MKQYNMRYAYKKRNLKSRDEELKRGIFTFTKNHTDFSLSRQSFGVLSAYRLYAYDGVLHFCCTM